MQEKQLVITLVIGCGLVALGLVPGLFQQMVQQLKDGMENFSGSMRGSWPSQFDRRVMRPVDEEEPQRVGLLALLGIGLVLLGLLNYVTRN